ncbi:Uncharacterised protein [Mycobacteroides abscessus subsp. massiliense]|nr:Uncharacterised protein [Mycobacteroides abscessus subsp. massiliense]SLC98328.1 Uncharacterised protein [Mycobacteroides abscessus subsp. massiliense]
MSRHAEAGGCTAGYCGGGPCHTPATIALGACLRRKAVVHVRTSQAMQPYCGTPSLRYLESERRLTPSGGSNPSATALRGVFPPFGEMSAILETVAPRHMAPGTRPRPGGISRTEAGLIAVSGGVPGGASAQVYPTSHTALGCDTRAAG